MANERDLESDVGVDIDEDVLDEIYRELGEEMRTSAKGRESAQERAMDAAARRYERRTRSFLRAVQRLFNEHVEREGQKHNTPNSPHWRHDPRTKHAPRDKPLGEMGDAQLLSYASHIDQVVEAHIHANQRKGFSAARRGQHDEIVGVEVGKAETTPRERLAVIMVGPMGSGKNYSMRESRGAMKKAGIDLDKINAYEIDHDVMKEHMWSRNMQPKVRDLKPRETAGIIHAESSHLADRVTNRLSRQGTNIIIQGTMRSPRNARARTAKLKAQGYKVLTVYVDTHPDIAKLRAVKRWQKGDTADPVNGGRFVAPAAIDHLKMPRGSKHRSKPGKVFEEILKPNTDAFLHINNDGVPFIVDSGGKFP